MTTAKPPARYGAMWGARPGGFALPSYTTTGDTTTPCNALVASTQIEGRTNRVAWSAFPDLMGKCASLSAD